tara:strand:- start:40 stop:867 length:828 start_codon:yes stop_codon:yes gene_type:complete
MYDDIIEDFRKEYEKEIRYIFDNSGFAALTFSTHGIPSPRKITPNRISRKWFNHLAWRITERSRLRRDSCSSVTLLPIIEKYVEQICERYEQYGEDDLMSILPELGESKDTPIIKFAKSIQVMYSIIELEYIPKKWMSEWSDALYLNEVISNPSFERMKVRKNWKHAGVDEVFWYTDKMWRRVSPLKHILLYSPLKELRYNSVEHIDMAYKEINSSLIKPILKVKDSIKTLIEITRDDCFAPPYILTYLEPRYSYQHGRRTDANHMLKLLSLKLL